MIVLHVVAPAAFGGLERVVSLLAGGQRRRGHQVHVAATFTDGGADASDVGPLAPLREAGVVVHPIRVGGRAYARERRCIETLCRTIRPRIVHTHGYRSDVLHGPVAASLGIGTVTTAHGLTGGDWRNRMYEWLQRRAFRRFGRVVAVSRPLAELLVRSGVSDRRVRVIQNAWSTAAPVLPRAAARMALDIASDHPRVGWVGRLSPEKGADVLLDALAHLAGVPVMVTVIGEGGERPRLMARAARLGVSNCIQWHGTVPDAAPFFSAFDAFVISSRTEGTPMALFEAMAAGVPAAAARVGGVPDVVGPREAFLFPPDDPPALAAAIVEAWAWPAEAAVRAGAARARLGAAFGAGPWLAAHEALYDGLRATPRR